MADDRELVAQVDIVRGAGGNPDRATTERATAVFLDDLAAIEQASRWRTVGSVSVVEVDAFLAGLSAERST